MRKYTLIPIAFLAFLFLFTFAALAQGPVEPICTADGIGQWQGDGKLPETRSKFATVSTDSRVFVLGGGAEVLVNDHRAITATERLAEIWGTTTPLSVPLNYPAAAFSRNKIYVMGGYADGYDLRSVMSARVTGIGLGDWESDDPLNAERIGAEALAIGDRLYVIGGDNTGSVEWSTVGAAGDLTAWQFGQPTIVPRNFGAAVASDDFVYVLGGRSLGGGSQVFNSVEMARINPDGSLGDWQLSTSMILKRIELRAIIINNYLYAIGGTSAGGAAAYNLVERSKINPDGTLGSWEFVSRLTTPRRLPGVVTVGDNLYAFGGENTGTAFDSIEVIDIGLPPPPPDYGLSINDGSLFTNQIDVTLTIGNVPPWTHQVQISNDGGFAGAGWQSYRTCKQWQITQYGSYIIPRVVYVRYKDSSGIVYGPFSDDIVLDITAPTGSVTAGNLAAVQTTGTRVSTGEIGAQANHTIYLPLIFKTGPAPNTTLYLTASDDVSGVGFMQISNRPDLSDNGWEPYNPNHSWYLPSEATVYVRFRDYAGNISKVYTAKR